MKKINVGCGTDIRKGWVNLDLHNRNGADCIFNLSDVEKGEKFPFKDNYFDYVLCSHVLEDFINPVPIMDELVRVTKVNGILDIKVPYETCTWGSIHHQKPFNVSTFFSYMVNANYDVKRIPLRIKRVKFYTRPITLKCILWSPIAIPLRLFWLGIYNILIKLKYHIVDESVIKYFTSGDIFLKVEYEKLGNKQEETFLEKLLMRIKR